jgi:[ribosomal protein S5]-alanine N-acetyltransferase
MTRAYDWTDQLPRLIGRRIDLRWLTVDDVPALFSVFGDSEVMRYWSSPPLADTSATRALLEEIHAGFRTRQLFQWGISSRETNEVLGTCTLFRLDLTHHRAEIGFALGRRWWGQGFATEALDLLLGFAFSRLDLHRLEADVDPLNGRSLRALERQGFRREGHLRERWHLGGRMHDSILLGLLRPEWIRADS